MVHTRKVVLVPEWVVPEPQQVGDLARYTRWLAEDMGHRTAQGEWAAVRWVTGQGIPPLTGMIESATWELARAQSWVALSRAANGTLPTTREWLGLGVSPRPIAAGDREFAYGAWRALAWLLGVRPASITEPPPRDADGVVLPGTELMSSPARPQDPAWQAGQQPRRERDIADARVWWEHVRARVAVTELSTR